MPLGTTTKIFGIDDAKISKLTADQSGSTPTYDSPIDVPGITDIKLSPKFVEKTLEGDEQILDYYSKLQSIDWSFDHVVVSLDALAVLLGGAVTESGTTPNETQTYDLTANDRANYFKLEGQSTYGDAGDIHLVLWKCKANKVDIEAKGGDYATISASGTAIPLTSNGKVLSVVINETATAIA